MSGETYIHRIDADNVIEFVNDVWLRFAAENWDAEKAERVVGTSLWDYVCDWGVRHLYEVLLGHVRETGQPVRVPYRCDSPDARRYMEMDVVPLPKDRVEFRCRTIREEPRDPVPVLDAEAPRGGEMLVMCSWCKRINVPPWMEAEDAIRELELFDAPTMPPISHGICEECRDAVLEAVR
jgi:hypothetical protein